MTLPASGDLSLSMIISEFGGGTKLGDFYRGGAYVPNTGTNAGVPASGDIRVGNFNGAASTAAAVVTLTAHTVSDDGYTAGGQGYAEIWLQATGLAYWNTNWSADGYYTNQWLTGGTPGNYEVYASTVSGTAGSGTLGTWLSLDVSRAWSVARVPTSWTTWVVQLQIRRKSDSVVMATASMTLTASGAGTGGNPCVALGSWMDSYFRVEDLRVGQWMMTHRPEDGFSMQRLERISGAVETQGVRITTESGAILRCSVSTPFNLRSATVDKQPGHWLYAPNMEGQYVMVERDYTVNWERVVSVEDIGIILVVPTSFGGRSFAAGDDPEARIYSHNMIKGP